MTILVDLSAYNLSVPEPVSRYKKMVSTVVSTYPNHNEHGITMFHSAFGYKLFNVIGSDTLAVAQFRKYMKEKVRDPLAAGEFPTIKFDSYLYSGGQVKDLAYTIQFCSHLLLAEEITEAKLFINQVCFNLANYTKSNWGGLPDIYTDGILDNYNGWARNDPLNNYFYSHLNVFIYAYLINPNPIIRSYLDARLQLLITKWSAWNKGSPEGTGYGLSLSALFAIIKALMDSTGEQFPIIITLAEKIIEFWYHCSIKNYRTKKFGEIISFMDHSRESRHRIYDGDRSLILHARALPISKKYKDMATAWLSEISHIRMTAGNYCHIDMLDHGTEKYFPQENYYFADSSGNFIWRDSWSEDATVISYSAGPNNQAHDQDDQGAFQVYHKGYPQATTANIFSKSGILNESKWHNVICFRDSTGKVIPQSTKNQCIMTMIDPNTIHMDLAPAYSPTLISSYTRKCTHTRAGITVVDTFQKVASVEAVSQIHTPYPPVISGNKVTAGMTEWTVETPGATISIVEPRETVNCYTIEIRGLIDSCTLTGVINTAIEPIELPGTSPTPTPEDPDMPEVIHTTVPKFDAPWIHICKRGDIGTQAKHGGSWHYGSSSEWIETKDLTLDDLVATCAVPSKDGKTCFGLSDGSVDTSSVRKWCAIKYLRPEQIVHCATAKPGNLTSKDGAALSISVYITYTPSTDSIPDPDPVPDSELVKELQAKIVEQEGTITELINQLDDTRNTLTATQEQLTAAQQDIGAKAVTIAQQAAALEASATKIEELTEVKQALKTLFEVGNSLTD